jgi:hypothetical protein
VQWLERSTLQIGYGRRARLLHSTLTDATPSLGVTLAKDKVRTARWLRQAGLPVPQHIEVADPEAALAAAERLGWPVVVKPADRDRGDGARANLSSPELVEAAFAHASAISKRVLVEKHITGHEYRLTVVNGELFWAHERVPASVTGDGHHSLRALIEPENARRRKALLTAPHGWVPIQMDADNLSYLQSPFLRRLTGAPVSQCRNASAWLLLPRPRHSHGHHGHQGDGRSYPCHRGLCAAPARPVGA